MAKKSQRIVFPRVFFALQGLKLLAGRVTQTDEVSHFFTDNQKRPTSFINSNHTPVFKKSDQWCPTTPVSNFNRRTQVGGGRQFKHFQLREPIRCSFPPVACAHFLISFAFLHHVSPQLYSPVMLSSNNNFPKGERMDWARAKTNMCYHYCILALFKSRKPRKCPHLSLEYGVLTSLFVCDWPNLFGTAFLPSSGAFVFLIALSPMFQVRAGRCSREVAQRCPLHDSAGCGRTVFQASNKSDVHLTRLGSIFFKEFFIDFPPKIRPWWSFGKTCLYFFFHRTIV